MATYWTDSSVGFALQANFATENTTAGDFVYIKAEQPSVTFDTEVSELDLMVGQVGAAAERIVGRRSGSITLTLPLSGFVAGYDPTNEDPGGAPVGDEVIPPALVLMANAMGSYASNITGATTSLKNTSFWRGGEQLACSPYAAAGVTAAGTTSTSVVVDSAAISGDQKAGQYILTGLSATTTTVQSGFIKTKAATPAPATTVDLTLFEASTNTVADNAANVYGTATGWQSAEQPVPMSIRWKGQDVEFGYRLIGAICESFTLTMNAAETPTVEFTFRFYDFIADKTIGGLVIPDAHDRIPQVIGTSNGRVTLGGATYCGLEDVTVGWSAGDLRTIVCHSADSGIESVTIVRPTITAAFSAPHKSTDPIYDAAGVAGNTGAHVWQSALELGTRISWGVECGSRAGRMFSVLIPSGIVTAAPVEADELVRYSVELEAGTYSGDTSDIPGETAATCPIDSIFRISQG